MLCLCMCVYNYQIDAKVDKIGNLKVLTQIHILKSFENVSKDFQNIKSYTS